MKGLFDPRRGDNPQGENCCPIGTVRDEEPRRMLVWLPMVEVRWLCTPIGHREMTDTSFLSSTVSREELSMAPSATALREGP